MKNKKNKLVEINSFKNFKLLILVGISGIMAISSIFLTIESATNGMEIANLQKKETELTTKQQELQQNLVTTLSINTLQEQSSRFGFAKVNDLVYVTDNESVAKLP